MDEKRVIGDRVKALRLGLGLSQAQVAARGQVDRPYVIRIEQGKSRLNGYSSRLGMARGLYLSTEEFDLVLSGCLEVGAAVKLAKARMGAANDASGPAAA